MTKNILTACFLLLICNGILGQSDFRNGYIVTLENDTLPGHVAYRTNSLNLESCIFSGPSGKKEFFPGDILGYGFADNEHFMSGIVENTFVEVLVTGPMSLYEAKDRFVIGKEGEYYELYSDRQMVYDRAKYEYNTVEKSRWRGKLSFLLNDCLKNSQRSTASIRLKEKDLTRLITRYNECRGVDYSEFKKNKPWGVFEFGASLGMANAQMTTKREDKFHNPKYMADPSLFEHLADSYESVIPTVGVVVSFTAPRISERFAFQTEAQYSQTAFQSLVVVERSQSQEYHDTYIELSTISVPLSVKYSFPERAIGFFMQGGAQLNFHIDSNSYVLSEEVRDGVVYTSDPAEAMRINDSQVGIWGGIGLQKSFSHFKSNMSLRYIQMSNLSNVFATKVNTNQIALNLILLK